jgi:hypothetical protein
MPSEKLTITGRLERAELKRQKPFHPSYYGSREQYDIFLDCQLTTDEGETVYFKSPHVNQSIASGGPFAINVYVIKNNAAGWFRELNADKSVASPGVPAENSLEPLFRCGQRITISGSVKARRVSQRNRPYVVLNRVKFLGMPLEQNY